MNAENTKSKVKDGQRWGRWSYDAANGAIEDVSGWGYFIRIHDTQITGHWIAHMSTKRWLDEADLHNLATALEEARR